MRIKNNQFWFWGFIVLLVLVISAVSTMGYKAYKFHNSGMYHKEFMHHKGWKDMDFSIDQRKFVRKSRIKHRQIMLELKSDQNIVHNNLFTEISKENTDSILIEQYRKQTIELSNKIMDETIRFYQELKTELNEEQMKQINKHISQRFCNVNKGSKIKNKHLNQ